MTDGKYRALLELLVTFLSFHIQVEWGSRKALHANVCYVYLQQSDDRYWRGASAHNTVSVRHTHKRAHANIASTSTVGVSDCVEHYRL